MKVQSSAFKDGGFMPKRYTQEGENISPPLSFSDVPDVAASLVLLVVDPDAPDPENPKMTFTHWIAYNLPPTLEGLPENVNIAGIPGALEGLNDRGNLGYIGPRPPIGVHRYFFKLFALNQELLFDKPPHPHRKELLEHMDGHVVASAEIVGLYKLTGN